MSLKPKNEDSEVEEPLANQWTAIEQADTAGILRKAGISARDYLMTLTVILQTMIDVTLNEKPRSEINKAVVCSHRFFTGRA